MHRGWVALGIIAFAAAPPHGRRGRPEVASDALPATVTAPAGATVRLSTAPSGELVVAGPGGERIYRPADSIELSVAGGAVLEIDRLTARRVELNARRINLAGAIVANEARLHADELLDIQSNGRIAAARVHLEGHVISNVGSVTADGATGGTIDVLAENVMNQGSLTARGLAADGGAIRIAYGRFFVESARGSMDASGVGRGGAIAVAGQRGSHLFTSGRQTARGARGGDIRLDADEVKLVVATLDASGARQGGSIRLGSKAVAGDAALATRELLVRPGTELVADGNDDGPGGRIVLASLGRTLFAGRASARGGARGGDGGAVEISSVGDLGLRGDVETGAPAGRPGRVLVDPKNITIGDAAAELFKFELLDPTPGAGDQFGSVTVPLSTGNVVVFDYYDDFGAADAGAMHLFSGRTGALLSTVIGNARGDFAYNTGTNGILVPSVVTLSNGNYVVSIRHWGNGAATYAGIVIWGSGSTGVAGPISAANSLVGSTAGEFVGEMVTPLTNGNYVVFTRGWDNGSIENVGAATWCNGSTGRTGVISAANSLIGSTAGDGVGRAVALTNGNYVVRSSGWHNGGIAVSATTWCNGSTGRVGTVSTDNSLVGSTAGDGGQTEWNVVPLANGNYVVGSPEWDAGGIADAGAATWCDGDTGCTGTISAANSLVGSTSGDNVGAYIIPLVNGNYVVDSLRWKGGPDEYGAVTWGSGTSGITGPVSATNSLVGKGVGGGLVTALANGNYVVNSRTWNATTNGAIGAVTWGDGAVGTTGVVSASNSLVGAVVGDNVGNGGVLALANGNYVVDSDQWNDGAATTVGAVTWGDGKKGTVGVVSAANSLVGSTANDRVGNSGSGFGVVGLTNGNYLVVSTTWSNGAVRAAGAVTWADGSTGVSGVVSPSNSLVGSTADDQVGYGGVLALANGNYVVSSTFWDNGATVGAGAVTWCNGSTGRTGPVSAANSLIGSQPDALLGWSLKVLPDSNYVFSGTRWDPASATKLAAVVWADGRTGRVGTVSPQNSIVNSDPNYGVGNAGPLPGTFLASFPTTGSGHVYVGVVSLEAVRPTFALAQEQSLTIPPGMIAAVLEKGTDLALEASNDITVAAPISVGSAQAGPRGRLSLSAGRSLSLAASLSTGGGDLTLVANDRLSSGVVDSQRDTGPGGITWAANVAVDAGGGAFRAEVRDGAGKTNRQSGPLELGAVSAARVVAQASGASLVVEGKVTASGGGDAITLVSDTLLDAHVAAADTLATPGGRFLIYAPDSASAATGALALTFIESGKTYPAPPEASNTGSGIIYATGPATPPDAGIDAGADDGGSQPDAGAEDGAAPDADEPDAATPGTDAGPNTLPAGDRGCGCTTAPGAPLGAASWASILCGLALVLLRRRRAR